MAAEKYIIRVGSAQEVVDFFDSVRRLYSEVAPALLDIGLRSWDEAVVAERDGQVVGAVTLAFNDLDCPAPGTLDTLYVLPGHRGKGLGTRLCESAINRFIGSGWTPVFCHVITEAMQRLVDRLPSELRGQMKLRLSQTDEFFDPETDLS